MRNPGPGRVLRPCAADRALDALAPTVRWAIGFVPGLCENRPLGLERPAGIDRPEPQRGPLSACVLRAVVLPRWLCGFGRRGTAAFAWFGTVAGPALPAIMEW